MIIFLQSSYLSPKRDTLTTNDGLILLDLANKRMNDLFCLEKSSEP